MSCEDYEAAGCAFTDGKLILAGYQPNKPQPFISGIGGMKEEGEGPLDTALRETLEELFEIQETSPYISELKATLNPSKVIQNKTYILLAFTFEDLDAILRILKSRGATSKMYSTFPETLFELLFDRKILEDEKHEISHLALLPLVRHEHQNPFVSSDFLEDMAALI